MLCRCFAGAWTCDAFFPPRFPDPRCVRVKVAASGFTVANWRGFRAMSDQGSDFIQDMIMRDPEDPGCFCGGFQREQPSPREGPGPQVSDVQIQRLYTPLEHGDSIGMDSLTTSCHSHINMPICRPEQVRCHISPIEAPRGVASHSDFGAGCSCLKGKIGSEHCRTLSSGQL